MFREEYKGRINDVMSNTTFLDNVFPNPVRRFDLPIEEYVDLANFWRETLEENRGKVFIPQKIYFQTCRGYTVLQRRISHIIGLPNGIREYQSALFSLIKEAKSHLFSLSAEEHNEYSAYLETIKELNEIYGIKKGHKNDNFADERLVAAAVYTSEFKKKESTIITNDRDISKFVAMYNLSRGLRRRVSVYIPKRIENHLVTNPIERGESLEGLV
ncbi:hypothetical protein CL616_04355 [archaeon]|nr:hypothetical protein [archaeon]